MIPVLLILIPLITGLAAFFIKTVNGPRIWALCSAVATMLIALASISWISHPDLLIADKAWLPALGSRFSLSMDGMSKMLCLLTAVSMPLIFASTYKNHYAKPNSFYGFMLLSQAGIMGVFLASDLLLFYFFWELALVPIYFLCSQWGGKKRIPVAIKFFIYTFIASLLMLVGIIYLYYKTPGHSFALEAVYALKLTPAEQAIGFWLFFLAFAVKMPLFPLHTWQPDTYEQAPTAVTMVLSGIMVKMGVYGVIRWIIPLFPDAFVRFDHLIILLSVIGMVYASLIAIRQDDLKRLIAYSSIAHIGLMCAAIFTSQESGMNGVMIQMFNHGINVIGLWIVADAIEQQMGTRKFSELGGLAQKAPGLAILLMVLALANLALPLTNSFIGEFLMFNGLFKYNFWMAAVAIICIILVAVYTLNMVQKIFYGPTVPATQNAHDSSGNVKWMLAIIVVIVFVLGVYPDPMFKLTNDTVRSVMGFIHRF